MYVGSSIIVACTVRYSVKHVMVYEVKFWLLPLGLEYVGHEAGGAYRVYTRIQAAVCEVGRVSMRPGK